MIILDKILQLTVIVDIFLKLSKIRSLMAEITVENFKNKIYKQIAKFDNNWIIFKNWKRSSCREYFP